MTKVVMRLPPNMLVCVSFALMFVGLSLTFFGSRAYGGLREEGLAAVYSLVVLGSMAIFVVSSSLPARMMGAGLMMGFWLGAADPGRLAWSIAGVGVQALACWAAIRAEEGPDRG
jgi:hypothetical protein